MLTIIGVKKVEIECGGYQNGLNEWLCDIRAKNSSIVKIVVVSQHEPSNQEIELFVLSCTTFPEDEQLYRRNMIDIFGHSTEMLDDIRMEKVDNADLCYQIGEDIIRALRRKYDW